MFVGYETDLSKSNGLFEKKVAPILKLLLGDSIEIITLEGRNEHLANLLDKRCCMDYLILQDGCSRGVSSRIQKDEGFRSFTIRASRDTGSKTEFEKITKAIKLRALHPEFHLQAYTDQNGDISCLGIMWTRDLMDYLSKSILFNNPMIELKHTHEDKDGQAGFYACYWDDIIKKGYKVKIYDRKQSTPR